MDEQLVAKLMGFGLPRLQKARGVVDPSDPDVGSLDEAITRLTGSHERNLARAGIEGDIGKMRDQGRVGEAEMFTRAGEKVRQTQGLLTPEERAAAPARNMERADEERDLARQNYEQAGRGMGGAIARQAKGTAASAAGIIPALIPTAEAARELADLGGPIDPERVKPEPQLVGAPGFAPPMMVKGEQARAVAKQLPREGDTSRYIEESPSPFVAKAVPFLLGAKAGSIPGVRQAVAPVNKLYQANEAMLGKFGNLLPPGAGRTQIVASGLTGAELGAVDAGIRRVPQALDPNRQVAPLDVANEIGVPFAFGAGAAVPSAARTGFHRMATNPNTQLGAVANEYARNVGEGTYRNELGGKPSGRFGIKQVADEQRAAVEDARSRAAQEFEAAKPERMEPILTSKRRGVEGLDLAKQQAEEGAVAQRGQVAAQVAPQVVQRLEAQRRAAKVELDDLMRSKEAAGTQIPAERTNSAVREFIADQAKSETRGTGKEVYTPEGEALRNIAGRWEAFMGSGGTVGDWVKMIRWLESQERGAPATARLYREFAGIVRHGREMADGTRLGGLANEDPEIGAGWARYREARTQHEKASDIAFRQPDLDKLPMQSPHGRLDVPLPGDPFTPQSLMPNQMSALRGRLMRVGGTGETDVAKAPELEELRGMGFEPELGAMESGVAGIEEARRARLSQLSDERAGLDADIAARESAATRRLQEETGAQVESAKSTQKRLNLAKEVQEASRFPRLGQMVTPSALVALGLPMQNAHAAFNLSHGLSRVSSGLLQPFASREATRSAPSGGMPGSLPSMLGVTLSLEPKESRDQVDQLVAGARGQTQRLRATIGERLKYNEQ